MKKKILIIDDQYGIRLLLYEVFSKGGYTAFQASNGKEALQIVREEKPDVILLDMKIPGMDGLEILRHIRKIDQDIHVIMMTAYGELDMLEEAKSYGVKNHFTKPFDIDNLRKTVEELFSEEKKSV